MMKYILVGCAATIVVGVAVLKSDLACEYSPISLSYINDCRTEEKAAVADASTEPTKAEAEVADITKTEPEAAKPEQEATADKAVEPIKDAVAEPKIVPTFDIVRVEADGSTLVAGRGAPNSTIILKDGGKEIGKAVSNDVGEWVIVVDEPIQTATATLSLIGMLPDGTEVESAARVNIAMREEISVKTAETAKMITKNKTGTNNEKSINQAAKVDLEPKAEAATQAVEIAKNTVTEATGPMNEVNARPLNEVNATASEEKAPAKESTPLVVITEKDKPAKILQGDDVGSKEEMTFNSMDYNEKGEIIFSGDAKPNELVRVYVNNIFVGEAKADAAGRWSLDKDYVMQTGKNDMRFDQVDAAGAVISRRETSIVMPKLEQANDLVALEDVAEGEAKAGRAIIIWGDNLWNISRKLYGKGELYTTIFKANKDQIRNPDLIYPGQVFILPEVLDAQLLDD